MTPTPAEKLAAFVDGLRSTGLLPAGDLESLASAAARPGANGEALARDLVRRDLLTPYQARKVWKGQGADLLLNQYVLMDKLGEGGMGEVFRARHLRLGRDVALKVMRRERLANPEAVRRFRREIRAAAALAHENVVMAYDADQSGDVHFFAMEYVAGTNLDHHVRANGPLPLSEAADYIRQIALGLQHAHEKGLIHRDIKPSNLLLSTTGEVKISDLGLVRVDDSDTGPVSRITKEGLTVGTPDFVAPEQARNPHAADIRADVYSLGCTFYFLLSGRVPYPDGTATEKMLQHAREPFPTLERTDLPVEVHSILARMTAKKPEQRYAQPAEVAEALATHIPKVTPPPLPALPVVATDEPLTDDQLPATREHETDSRFALPSSAGSAKPKARKGCLPLVIAGLAIAIVGLMKLLA